MKKKAKLEIIKAGREYLWALKASNGRYMTGQNVTFETRGEAISNALNTKKAFAEAEIVDKKNLNESIYNKR